MDGGKQGIGSIPERLVDFCFMNIGLRLILVLTGTAAYLGLAVLGWNGLAAYCANPARIALAIVLLALSAVALFASGNLSSGVREDRGNRWVIAGFTVVGLVGGFVPAYTDRVEFWTLDGDTLRWVGVVLMAIGGAPPRTGVRARKPL